MPSSASPPAQHRRTSSSAASYLTLRTVLVPGLEPGDDLSASSCQRTRLRRARCRPDPAASRRKAVEVSVELPDLGLSSGLGCKVDVPRARRLLTSNSSVPGRAHARAPERSVPAIDVQVTPHRQDDLGPDGSLTSTSSVIRQSSRKTEHDGNASTGSSRGRRYHGHREGHGRPGADVERTGHASARASAVAVVTFHKLVGPRRRRLRSGPARSRSPSTPAGRASWAAYGFQRARLGRHRSLPGCRAHGASARGSWTSSRSIDGTLIGRRRFAVDWCTKCDWQRRSQLRRSRRAASLRLREHDASTCATPFVTGRRFARRRHDAYLVFEANRAT